MSIDVKYTRLDLQKIRFETIRFKEKLLLRNEKICGIISKMGRARNICGIFRKSQKLCLHKILNIALTTKVNCLEFYVFIFDVKCA